MERTLGLCAGLLFHWMGFKCALGDMSGVGALGEI